jgi:hypothetical protein
MDEALIPTFCAWQQAQEAAATEGLRFHPAWAADFWQFVADLGQCPDEGELVCTSHFFGYTPGNCSWTGMGIDEFPLSYEDCPVSVGFLKAGLITEKAAIHIAMLDMDPESCRQTFKELDASTAGQSQEARVAAVAATLKSLIKANGLVPKGNPNRWQIYNQCRQYRAINNAARRDECTEQLPEFAGDPRCRRGLEFVDED